MVRRVAPARYKYNRVALFGFPQLEVLDVSCWPGRKTGAADVLPAIARLPCLRALFGWYPGPCDGDDAAKVRSLLLMCWFAGLQAFTCSRIVLQGYV